MAKAKGSTLVGAVISLRKQKEAARKFLPDSLQHYLSETVQLAAWYPEEDLLGIIRALIELTPGSRDDALNEMGILTAQSLGEGLYSHLMQRTGTASSSFALWSAMHDSGRLTTTIDPDTKEITIELADYALPSYEMCAVTGAFIEETLRMNGQAPELRKDACVVSGDDCCRWKANEG
jgi:hypothetical protein